MKYGELNLGQIEAIVNKLGGMEGVQRFLSGASEVVVKGSEFHLAVDYTKSLEEMIVAGRYDWTNDDITAKRFAVEGEGTVEYEARCFHFNRDISSENAIREIESANTENPWMPAKIEHLLSFGAKYSEEQRKYPIVALGSVAKVDGRRAVPCLSRSASERDLHLPWFGVDWSSYCRFLAVRKVSVA